MIMNFKQQGQAGLIQAHGYNGDMSFDGQTVTITQGKAGERQHGWSTSSFPVSSVSSVIISDAHMLTNGSIAFVLRDADGADTETPENAGLAQKADYPWIVIFTRKQASDVSSFAAAIDAAKPDEPTPIDAAGTVEWEKDKHREAWLGIKANGYHVKDFHGKAFDWVSLNEKTITHGDETKSLIGVHATYETISEMKSRITATRLLALGPLALAAQKKSGGEQVVNIEGPDFFWAVDVQNEKKAEARQFAAKVNDLANQLTPAPALPDHQPSAADNAASLMGLADLHAKGIITDEEFAAAKAKALGI